MAQFQTAELAQHAFYLPPARPVTNATPPHLAFASPLSPQAAHPKEELDSRSSAFQAQYPQQSQQQQQQHVIAQPQQTPTMTPLTSLTDSYPPPSAPMYYGQYFMPPQPNAPMMYMMHGQPQFFVTYNPSQMGYPAEVAQNAELPNFPFANFAAEGAHPVPFNPAAAAPQFDAHAAPNSYFPFSDGMLCFSRVCFLSLLMALVGYFKADPLKAEEGGEDEQSKFVCPYENCGKRFKRNESLNDHYRIHTGEKPYKCPHPGCDRAYAHRSGYSAHLKVHSGVRPFACTWPDCTKRFADGSQLRAHMRSHTGEKPYECKICGKRFSVSPNLTKHLRTHTRGLVFDFPG